MARNSRGTATTSAATVTVTIGNNPTHIYVTNHDGAGELTFTIDGTTATNGGDDMLYVPAVAGAWRRIAVTDQIAADGTIDIDIIASASTVYSIQVDDE